jgi:hypothetical protein
MHIVGKNENKSIKYCIFINNKIITRKSSNFKHIMYIIPKNITIQDNTIDIEHNGEHWCHKGGIVALIKNNDKIDFRYVDATTNNIVLFYDDGMEKFSIPLNKKINMDTHEKIKSTAAIKLIDTLFDQIKIKIKENKCKKTEEEKKIEDHKKIINDYQKIIDDHQKIIDDHQKIIKDHTNKVNIFDGEIIDLFETLKVLFKHEAGIQLNFDDNDKLLSKEIITYEHFIANSIACDIDTLIGKRKNCKQLQKLIIDKKININIKNKEGMSLLGISIKKHNDFPIFLLENDIDISFSVEHDVKIHNSTELDQAYFNNAKRNNRLDLLVSHCDYIHSFSLKQLVEEHIKSTKKQ